MRWDGPTGVGALKRGMIRCPEAGRIDNTTYRPYRCIRMRAVSWSKSGGEESRNRKEETMTNKTAFTRSVEESEATGKVKEVYEDIKKTLGISFIPNMYKAMANTPGYLEATWNKVQAIMTTQGKLDSKTKDIIALTVSIMGGCDYCIGVYNETVRHAGLDDEAMTELYAVIDTYTGLNRFNVAAQTKPDEKPWYGCGVK